ARVRIGDDHNAMCRGGRGDQWPSNCSRPRASAPRPAKRTPRAEVLGKVDGFPGFPLSEPHRSAQTFPGLPVFPFHPPLTFSNADYLRHRALAGADAAGPGLQWFVIDAIPISDVDINGLYAFRDLRDALEARGVTLIIAGRRTEFLMWLREIDLYRPDHEQRLFPTLGQAMKVYIREARRSELPPPD